jgi:hypothetical protein
MVFTINLDPYTAYRRDLRYLLLFFCFFSEYCSIATYVTKFQRPVAVTGSCLKNRMSGETRPGDAGVPRLDYRRGRKYRGAAVILHSSHAKKP